MLKIILIIIIARYYITGYYITGYQGMGVILPGVERDFPPVFSWDWDGKRLKFVMHFGNRR